MNYCPECGWMMDEIIFYGNNGYYLRDCCTFCGYSEKIEVV
jgi:hypothetical protein